MVVLITGASGLVGRWTLHHWGAEPVLPLRGADGDLLQPGTPTALLERHRPDAVVHLAWCASSSPGYRHSPDNDRWLAASLELHQACAAQGIRLWLTGSAVDDDPTPADAYTASKVALREHVRSEVASGAVGWLRPSYVFDEAARSPSLVAAALAARDRGEPVELRTPDDAHDFVHASDVGRAVALAVAHDLRGLVPIGSGGTHRVRDLVEALGARWRATAEVAPARADETLAVTRLAALGWGPTTTDELFQGRR